MWSFSQFSTDRVEENFPQILSTENFFTFHNSCGEKLDNEKLTVDREGNRFADDGYIVAEGSTLFVNCPW